MEYTVVDLFSESAVVAADLFDEANEGDNEQKSAQQEAENLTDEAIKKLKDSFALAYKYYETALKELKKVCTKKDEVDEVKDITELKEKLKTVGELLNKMKNDDSGKTFEDAKQKLLESDLKEVDADNLIKKCEVPENQKESINIIKTNLERYNELVKEFQDLKNGYSTFEKIKMQAKKVLATLKTLDPKWKAAGSVALAISSYAVLVMVAKRAGYTGNVVNLPAVFKFFVQNKGKFTVGKFVVIGFLAATFVAGVSSGGYYGFIVIKRYFENKKLEKKSEE